MNEIVTAAISGVTAILAAWITVSQSRDKRAREERQRLTDERETLKARRELLTLEYLDANAKATIACSKAIVDGKLNGELKKAARALKDAGDEHDRFLKEQGLKKVS